MTDVTVAQETNADAAVEKRTEETADLDTLLAEFDQGTKKEAVPQPEPNTVKEEAVPAWAQDLQRRYFQEDIQKVTDDIFDGMDVSSRLKNAWIDQIAREKPAVARAFANRHNDPTTWNKVLTGLKPEAQKDFPGARKVDPEATADKFAVAQAVRGASTKVAAEPAPNFAKMTDAELNRWKMENMK